MLRKSLLIVVLFFVPLSVSAQEHRGNKEEAISAVVRQFVPDTTIVGKARLKVLFWKVYDATLFAPKGVWNMSQPFALELRYLRDFDGGEIAKRSIKEMKGQDFDDEVVLNEWYDQMYKIFPDVKKGDSLLGIWLPDKVSGSKTLFYQGAELLGEVKDERFGSQFFGIWLNEKTSEPEMRRSLLGMK